MSNNPNPWKSTKGSGNIWNPKKDEHGNDVYTASENDFIDGYYSGVKHDVGPHSSNVYTLTSKDTGEDTEIWGDTVLNESLKNIRMGTYIRVQYLGRKLKKNFDKPGVKITDKNSYSNWEVFVNTQEKPMDIAMNDGFADSSPKQQSAATPVGNVAKGSTAGKSFVAKDDGDDLPF